MAKKLIVKYLDPNTGKYEFATVADIGDLEQLKTTVKTDLVSAINSIQTNGNVPSNIQDQIDQINDILGRLGNTLTDEQKKIIEDIIGNMTVSIDENIKLVKEESEKNRADLANLVQDVNSRFEGATNDYNTKVDAINKDLNDAKLSIDQTLGELSETRDKLNTIDLNYINVEKNIDDIKGELSTKVDSTDFDLMDSVVKQNTTDILQNKKDIALKASQDALDLVTDRVQQAEASLVINAEAIESKVSYAEMQGEIEKIGKFGKNYLNGTRNWKDWASTDALKAYASIDEYRHCKIAVIESVNAYLEFLIEDKLVIGETYTASINFKADNLEDPQTSVSFFEENNAYVLNKIFEDVSVINGWKRMYISFVATDENPVVSFRFTYLPPNSKGYLSAAKIEKGDKATDWEANSEDDNNAIVEANSVIKQNADSIINAVERIEKNEEDIVSTNTRIEQTDESIKLQAKKIEEIDGEVTEQKANFDLMNDEISMKVSQTDVNQSIADINIDNKNRILNSDFSREFENWNENNGFQIKEIDGINYAYASRKGTTAENNISIASDKFKAIEGNRFIFAFDMFVEDLAIYDVRKPIIIEIYNINDVRVDMKQFDLTELNGQLISKQISTFTGKYEIDREDAAKARIRFALNQNGEVGFSRVILQVGDIKSTSWSPAPEDAQIVQSKLETEINQTADSIKLLATKEELNQVDGKAEGALAALEIASDKIGTIVTETEDNTTKISELIQKSDEFGVKVGQMDEDLGQHGHDIAELKVKNNEINLGVSRVEESLEKVSDDLNSIGGGRNYLLKSKSFQGYAQGNIAGMLQADGTIRIDVNTDSNGQPFAIINTLKTSSVTNISNNFKPGEPITFSIWLKGAATQLPPEGYIANGMGYIKATNSTEYMSPDKYTRYDYSFKYNLLSGNIAMHVRFNNQRGNYILGMMAIYKSSKGMDWIQAPEDLDGKIDETLIAAKTYTNAELQVKADEINLGVKEVKETVDNMEIGGRNLLDKSASPQFSSYQSATITRDLNQTVAEWGATDAVKHTVSGGTGTDATIVGTLRSNIKTTVEKGKKYTHSIYIKNSGTTTLGISNNLGVIVDVPAGKVVRVEVKGTGSSTQTQVCQFVLYRKKKEDTLEFYAWHAKIETGNKATDWTEAPEDVDKAIDSALTTSKTYTDTQIKLNTEEINLGITQKVVEEVGKVEIGGRNYYRTDTSITSKVGNMEVIKNYPDCNNGFYFVGREGGLGSFRINNVINSNGYWTVSFWVRGSQNASVNFQLDICDLGQKRIVTTADNTWKKVTLTVNVTNHVGSPQTYHFVDFDNVQWAYFFVKDFKVEKGSVATDWTLAPEDEQKKIDSAIDKINLNSRNLLGNTKDFSVNGGKGVVDPNNSYLGNSSLKVTFSSTSGTYVDPFTRQMTIVPTATEYTLTFWAKADKEISFSCFFYSPNTTTSSINSDGYGGAYADGRSTFNATTEWKQYWVTWKQSTTTAKKTVIVGRLSSAGTIWINSPMLVEGNKPQSWQPAPEDNNVYPAWSNSPDGSVDFTRTYPSDNLLHDTNLLDLNQWGISTALKAVANGDGTVSFNKTDVTTARASFSTKTGKQIQSKVSAPYAISIDIYIESDAKSLAGSNLFLRQPLTNGSYVDFCLIQITDSLEKNKWLTLTAKATSHASADVNQNISFTLAFAGNALGKFRIRKPKVVFGSNPLPYTPMASEDPMRAEMGYVGYATQSSDNPSDYTWNVNPKAKGTFKRWANSIDGTVDFTDREPNINRFELTNQDILAKVAFSGATSTKELVYNPNIILGEAVKFRLTEKTSSYVFYLSNFKTVYPFVAGNMYTFSFYAKADKPFAMSNVSMNEATIHNHNFMNITTEYKRYFVSFRPYVNSSAAVNNNFHFFSNDNTNTINNDIYIHSFKLEDGAVVTPYITADTLNSEYSKMRFVGFGARDSDNPNDFVWQPNTEATMSKAWANDATGKTDFTRIYPNENIASMSTLAIHSTNATNTVTLSPTEIDLKSDGLAYMGFRTFGEGSYQPATQYTMSLKFKVNSGKVARFGGHSTYIDKISYIKIDGQEVVTNGTNGPWTNGFAYNFTVGKEYDIEMVFTTKATGMTTGTSDGIYVQPNRSTQTADWVAYTATITKFKVEEGQVRTPFITSPNDDPANSIMLYEGTSLKGGNNPADYTWYPMRASATEVKEVQLQLTPDSIYAKVSQAPDYINWKDLVDSKPSIEDLTNVYDQLEGLSSADETILASMAELEISNNGVLTTLTKAVEDIDGTINTMTDYMFFGKNSITGTTGLTIGKSNSPMKVIISNTELAFYDNSTRVAWVDSQRLNIAEAVVENRIKVGNHIIEKFNDKEEITIFKYDGV